MRVHSVRLRDYRNYQELELSLDGGVHIFLGQNAQGKTNILEAVSYASLGHSHRTRTDSDLIRWEKDAASLQLTLERMDVSQEIGFEFYRDKKRRILWNGHPIPTKELVGKLNTVLFSPDDLLLIKGAPSERRRFLDTEISQADPAYYREILSYARIMSQRNSLLKRIRERSSKREMLEPWNQQLAETAARVAGKRIEAVRKLHMLANLMQRRISDNEENLSITYEMHGSDEKMTNDLFSWYNKKLEETQETDILRGSTGIGPHRDDLVLSVNGVDLRSFGSQGQQRTGALALKLSELEFLRSETGEYPVLLLDDVMSELDALRRRQLLRFIEKEHIQTLITATDPAYFPQKDIGIFYHVRAGTVQKEGKQYVSSSGK